MKIERTMENNSQIECRHLTTGNILCNSNLRFVNIKHNLTGSKT